MALLTRKKLEIIVEAHALERVEQRLAAAGFKGWSVFAGAEGRGAHGIWRQTGVDEAGLRLIIAIGGEEAAEAALSWLVEYFDLYPGVVALSDVQVLRSERF
jgi:nitrogen regulatory protein PII